MPKPNSTLIAVVLDRSGSMGSIFEDTCGGFNRFVEEQKKETSDEALMTLTQFSTDYNVVFNARPLNEVPLLSQENYRIGGGTALLDAMGKTINDVGAALRAMPDSERPEAVVFVVITDGEENSSREFTKDKIGEMIKHQEEKYAWNFVFLGANFDAIQAGGSLGIRTANAMNFKASSKGAQVMYASLGDNVRRYRGTKAVSDLSFSAQQRADNDNPDAVDLGESQTDNKVTTSSDSKGI